MSFIIIADTQNGACCSGEGTALQFNPQTLTSEQLETLRQLLGTGAAGGAQELTTSEVVKLLTHRISEHVSPKEMMGLTSVFGSSDWLLPAREGTLTVGRAVEMLAEKVYRARAAEGGVAATSEGGVVSASSEIMEQLNEKFAKYNEAFKSIQEFLQSGAAGTPVDIWEQKATGESLGDKTMLSFGEYVLGGTDNTAEHSLRDVVAALVNGQRYAFEKLQEHYRDIWDITSNPPQAPHVDINTLKVTREELRDLRELHGSYIIENAALQEEVSLLSALAGMVARINYLTDLTEAMSTALSRISKREQMLHDVVQDLIRGGQLSYEKYTDKEHYGGNSFSESY